VLDIEVIKKKYGVDDERVEYFSAEAGVSCDGLLILQNERFRISSLPPFLCALYLTLVWV
jgi:hypothetical protein